MYLNNQQYLGSVCEGGGPYSTGCGNFSGSGSFNAVGRWSGFGLYSGSGYFEGSGTFVSSGTRNEGHAPGFVGNTPWDQVGNGLPYLTYSGFGIIDGSDVEGYNPRPIGYFYGRNYFLGSGVITGSRVPTNTFTGNGVVTGSGRYFIIGELYNTGIIMGSGCITGLGRLRREYPTPEPAKCYVCNSGLVASGDFSMTGVFSGQGILKAYSTGQGALISGSGSYHNLSGIFSGYSDRAFWGFGNFTGEQLVYPSVASNGFYGIGHYSGTGTIRGETGWFSGSGWAKGNGYFFGRGSLSGLQQSINIVSGSGCALGYGDVLGLNSTSQVTGILCRTVDPYGLRRKKGCGDFPPYLTNCNEVGDIFLDFEYQGDCSIAGVD